MVVTCPTERRRRSIVFFLVATAPPHLGSKLRMLSFSPLFPPLVLISLSFIQLQLHALLTDLLRSLRVPRPPLYRYRSLPNLSLSSALAVSLISLFFSLIVCSLVEQPQLDFSSFPSLPRGAREPPILEYESSKIKPGCKAMVLTSQSSPRDPDQFPTAQLFLLVSRVFLVL